MPWWLRRIERGGQVLAPGTPSRPLQYIDARDMDQQAFRWIEALLDQRAQRR